MHLYNISKENKVFIRKDKYIYFLNIILSGGHWCSPLLLKQFLFTYYIPALFCQTQEHVSTLAMEPPCEALADCLIGAQRQHKWPCQPQPSLERRFLHIWTKTTNFTIGANSQFNNLLKNCILKGVQKKIRSPEILECSKSKF